MNNTEIWDKLKTVPSEHLKPFTRGGGFRGTAIKPIWSILKMTEVFGPVGQGWGVKEPVFQVIPAGDEILVFCTVHVWHGSAEQEAVGVGGDKVLAKFKDGLKADDEAFKKAFTDAVGNALKYLGVGAEVHMGHYDGAKHVHQSDDDGNGKAQDAPERPKPLQAIQWQATPPAPSQGSAFAALEKNLRTIEDAGKLDQWVGEAQAAKAAGRVTTSEWGRLRSLHAARVAFLAQAPSTSAT